MKNKNNIISIHSLHTEGDLPPQIRCRTKLYFNPLPPHGGRLIPDSHLCILYLISIHSLHTEGDRYAMVSGANSSSFQSTPSTRRETVCYVTNYSTADAISIHSLHTEGDAQELSHAAAQIPFQSTPSTRRETQHPDIPDAEDTFQSTPSTRRETVFLLTDLNVEIISIHSLHTEGDWQRQLISSEGIPFQSTPSTRRETAAM